MRWLSKGIEELIAQAIQGSLRYDVVIVGSGYGGAVAASRLARSRKADGKPLSVCLLERGKEYLPGEFPSDLSHAPGAIRLDRHEKAEILGDADALFDVRTNEDVNVLVGNALGGGSQINAAVALRPDVSTMRDCAWPTALRGDLGFLNEKFDLAETWLGVASYPKQGLPKLQALAALGRSYAEDPVRRDAPTFQDISRFLGGERVDCRRGDYVNGGPLSPRFSLLPLAIRFGSDQNMVDTGVSQDDCRHCGECCSGCNYRAKNTLTMNYLPDAKQHDAHIYTGALVKRIVPSNPERDDTEWQVVVHRQAREKDPAVPGEEEAITITASILVIAAGTLGSTELLFNSESGEEETKLFSRALGARFSCNGDMIAFGYDQSTPINPIGCGATDPGSRPDAETTGPMATGMLDFRDQQPAVIIEDGAIPAALGRVFGEIVASGAALAELAEGSTDDPDSGREPQSVWRKAIAHTQVYLMMGRDEAKGRLSLQCIAEKGKTPRTRVGVVWPNASDDPVYKKQRDLLEQVRQLRGVPLMNPLWTPVPEDLTEALSGAAPRGSLITVHPLGGCAMGDDIGSGVVNHKGQVFSRRTGRPFTNLYICDGAIIPLALSINPLLTITALAERIVHYLVCDRKWEMSLHRGPVRALAEPLKTKCNPARGQAQPIRLRMHEVLAGTLDASARAGDALYENFRLRERPVRVRLEISYDVPDLVAFMEDRNHSASIATGSQIEFLSDAGGSDRLRCAALSGHLCFLRLEPTTQSERIALAFRHYWTSRGKVDLAERYGKTGRRAGWVIDRWLELSSVFGERRRLRIPRWLAKLLDWAIGRLVPRMPDGVAPAKSAMGIMRIANHAGHRRVFDYDLSFSHSGRSFRLQGKKEVNYAPGVNPWRSVAELKLTLKSAEDQLLASGLVSLDFVDLVKNRARHPQVLSDEPSPVTQVHLMGLVALFARVMVQTYFWSFRLPYQTDRNDCVEPYPPEWPRFPAEVAGLAPPTYYWIPQHERNLSNPIWKEGESIPKEEKLRLLLTHYQHAAGSQPKGPVLVTHGFAHSTQIFTLDTLPTNLTQALCRAGLDVWLLDLRTSIALDSVDEQSELEDVAKEDIPAAVDKIIAVAQPASGQVKVLAHCMGAAMFLIAALGGKLGRGKESKIERAMLSQVGLIPVGSKSNELRAELAAFLRDALELASVDCRVPPRPSAKDIIADRLAATYPSRAARGTPDSGTHMAQPPGGGHAKYWGYDSAVCDRITALYGHNWDHENLSAATHARVGQMLGKANIRTFSQITQFIAKKRVMDACGHNRYVQFDAIDQHLGFPIGMIQGRLNDVFDIDTLRRTQAYLYQVREWYAGQVAEIMSELRESASTFDTRLDTYSGAVEKLTPITDDLLAAGQAWTTALVDAGSSRQALQELHGKFQEQLTRLAEAGASHKADDTALYQLQRITDALSAFSQRAAARHGDRFKTLDGFVHLDCIIGKNAHEHVFPYATGFLVGEDQGLMWDAEPSLPKLSAPAVGTGSSAGEEDKQRHRKKSWRRPPKAGPVIGHVRLADQELIARVWSAIEEDVAIPDGDSEPAKFLLTRPKLDGEPSTDLQQAWKIRQGIERFGVADVRIPLSVFDQCEDLEIELHTYHARPDTSKSLPSAILRLFGGTESVTIERPAHVDDDTFDPEEVILDGGTKNDLQSGSIEVTRKLSCVTLRRSWVKSLTQRNSLCFIAGSCRHPGTAFERRRSDKVFGAIRKLLDATPTPSFLMALGDQIYFDATAEMFDTATLVERVVERYTTAYVSENFEDLASRLPIYTTIDDHELFDNWEPSREGHRLPPSPLNPAHGDREQMRAIGIRAYRCFQWAFSPMNGARANGKRPLWYQFDQNGFSFFVMDTRTERRRSTDAGAIDATTAEMIDGDQLAALKRFLRQAANAPKSRPKFICTSCVFAPVLQKNTQCHDGRWRNEDPYRIGDDGWNGFPATRNEVLKIIADDAIENVVFLAGDAHCTTTATISIETPGRTIHAYSINTSPFYSPYPFADEDPGHYLPGAILYDDDGVKAYYRLDFKRQGCSFSRLSVKADGAAWKLTMEMFDSDGHSQSSQGYTLT